MSAPLTEIIEPEEPGINAPEFHCLDKALQKLISHVHFTVFVYSSSTDLLERIYSTNPLHNPVGGAKKMIPEADWPQTVLIRKEPHFCRDRAEISRTFSDASTIFAMGAHSQLSIPIVETDGVVLGAYNLCGEEGVYTDETLLKAEEMMPIALEAMRRYKKRAMKSYHIKNA